MTRSDTIELLNESDDLTRRMDFQLLQAEQTWDFGDGGWVPGDPLWPKPMTELRETTSDDICSCGCGTRIGDSTYVHSQVIRNMVDVFEESDYIDAYRRCLDCDVGWDRLDEVDCWFCGKVLFEPIRQQNFEHTLVGQVTHVVYDDRGLQVYATMTDNFTPVMQRMIERLTDDLYRELELPGIDYIEYAAEDVQYTEALWRLANPSMRGFRTLTTIIDESYEPQIVRYVPTADSFGFESSTRVVWDPQPLDGLGVKYDYGVPEVSLGWPVNVSFFDEGAPYWVGQEAALSHGSSRRR